MLSQVCFLRKEFSSLRRCKMDLLGRGHQFPAPRDPKWLYFLWGHSISCRESPWKPQRSFWRKHPIFCCLVNSLQPSPSPLTEAEGPQHSHLPALSSLCLDSFLDLLVPTGMCALLWLLQAKAPVPSSVHRPPPAPALGKCCPYGNLHGSFLFMGLSLKSLQGPRGHTVKAKKSQGTKKPMVTL